MAQQNSIHLSLKKPTQYVGKLPKILVMGIGGGGCNAINNMMENNVEGVEFVIANTDMQSIERSKCNRSIQLGKSLTGGQGAGSFPEVGLAAAEESTDEIRDALQGVQLLFLTAGMGGGTGSGATPYIAKIAREMDILTVAVVTKPFKYEAESRLKLADEGISELKKYVDTMIILPNENLFRIANKETKLIDAFKMSDNVLYLGVRGITDLIMTPGLINLDFADVKMVIRKMGKAMMGMGEADGENRAIKAVEEALSNPLLEDVDIRSAKGALVNITGSPDITLFEFDEAAKKVRDEIGGGKATIKVGTAFMKDLDGKIRVSIFATGIECDDWEGYDYEDEVEPNAAIEKTQEIKYKEESISKPDENLFGEKNPPVFNRDTNKNETFFDIGKPRVEENFSNDKKTKPAKREGKSLFSFFDSFSKSDESEKKEPIVRVDKFNSKNKEIEFKTSNINENIDENLLNIPAYLRNKNKK